MEDKAKEFLEKKGHNHLKHWFRINGNTAVSWLVEFAEMVNEGKKTTRKTTKKESKDI